MIQVITPGMIRNRQGPFPRFSVGGSPAGDGLSLPESFEDLDQWTDAWLGDKGAGVGWIRTDADAADGIWCLAQDARGTDVIYAPEIVWEWGGDDLVVSIKNPNNAAAGVIQIRFAVNGDNTSWYAIGINAATAAITIQRDGVIKKTRPDCPLPDNTWRDLEIHWRSVPTITWTWRGVSDNWTDPSPFDTGGIGIVGNNNIAQPADWRVDWFRES
ncbi:hypothetical protein ES707_13392 [subsurface metagenome]